MLEQLSIHAFLEKYQIKNEVGERIEFKDHPYLWDIYKDFSPKLCVIKAAQIGMTVTEIIKLLWGVMNKGVDAIYILPTDSDVNIMVGSKINRIIAQNPIFQKWTKDKDTIEQKQIGNNYIHFKGSWSKKAPIMISSDWNLIDEIDASKQEIIEHYSTRLQHSKHQWEHIFSHPSTSGYGIDKYWQNSDQKHWLIKCDNGHEQYMSWPESFDIENEKYICKKCGIEITDDNRRYGRWAKKKSRTQAEFSGYWIPLFIRPKIQAKEIIKYYKEKTEEYFYNKVLGLPYVGGGNKLSWEMFAQNLTSEMIMAADDEPIVIGIDTGLKLDYVMGGRSGLFYQGEAKDYDELDRHMIRWKKAIAIIDEGGDLIGSRKFQERWKGRVFLCYTGADRKKQEIISWGVNEEYGRVSADRNRLIQLTVDYFRDRRIPCQGNEVDWLDYWNDWNNLTRIKLYDPLTGEAKGYKWVRSGRDHRALATCYWVVGMTKFGFGGAEILGETLLEGVNVSPEVKPNQTIQSVTITGEDPVQATLRNLKQSEDDDWRNR